MARALYPNIGAEEGDWQAHRQLPAVRALRALFESAFEPPAFPSLAANACFAWLNTPEAARFAADRALPLFGAEPEVVRHVHDKAFAWEAAARLGAIPEELAGAHRVLAPDELRDAGRVLEAIEHTCGDPFTLKPRIGTSGRGRIGRREELAAGLPRLRASGGAVLEPWLERVQDFAVLLCVAPGGEVQLLGSAELLTSRVGGYLGHRGRVDRAGRMRAGGPHDEVLEETGRAVAGLAAQLGFHGPCGIDAFTYRGADGRETLRPIVEVNARFSAGTLAIGVLRQRLGESALARPADFSFLLRASVPDELPPGVQAWAVGRDSLLLAGADPAAVRTATDLAWRHRLP